MRKVLLFGALGAVGCLLGWAGGEILLKAALPWANSFAARGAAASSIVTPPEPPQLEKPGAQQQGAVPVPAPPLEPEPFRVEAPAEPPPPNSEFAQRLEREGAKTGDVEIALIWWNLNDLDLHVIDPAGEEIYFEHPRVRSGGELDVDMNAGAGRFSREPVEHVYFPKGAAPPGHYKVYVVHFADRGQDPTKYVVDVKANGQRKQYNGIISDNRQRGAIARGARASSGFVRGTEGVETTKRTKVLLCEFDVGAGQLGLRVSAPEAVAVLPGGTNEFRVRIARRAFSAPVDIKVEGGETNGLVIKGTRIPPGETGASLTVQAKSEGRRGNLTVRVVAQADTGRGNIRAEAQMTVSVIDPPPPQPVLRLALPDTVQILQKNKSLFKARIGRYFFPAPVPVTIHLDTGLAEVTGADTVIDPSVDEALIRVNATKGAPPGKRTARVTATAASPYTAVHAEGALSLEVVALPPSPPAWPMVVVVSLWTVLLAIGVALALIVGQNYYLRRRLLGVTEALKGTGGSIGAGLIAGALGQLLFQSAADAASFEVVRRIAAWTLLGGLLGLGMTFFVPNLKTWRALSGGALGGLVGSLGFLAGAGMLADFAGRLLGAASLGFFIGLMIALAEQLAREACLLVHWAPKETTTVNLGAQPVILGSSPEAHVYLPKEKGFPPVTGLVSFVGGKVEFENKINGQKQALRNGSKLQLGTLVIEVKTAK
jgi:hypothetical protein